MTDEFFCCRILLECDRECANCFVTLEGETSTKACDGCIVSEVRKMVDEFLEILTTEENDE